MKTSTIRRPRYPVAPVRNTFIVLFLVALGPWESLAQENRFTLSDDERQRLVAGECLTLVEDSGDAQHLRVVALIDAPLERVWQVVTDYDTMHQWFPDLKESKALSTDGNVIMMYGRSAAPFPIADREWKGTARKSCSMDKDDRFCVSSWEMVPGSGNVRRNEGRWHIQRWSETQTLVLMENYIDPGLLLPDALLRTKMRKQLPAIISGLRKFCTSSKAE